MRYSEFKQVLKEDGEAAVAPAACGDTTAASVATVVSALGASTKKKKSKPVVLKRQ